MIPEEGLAINKCGFQGCVLIIWFISQSTEEEMRLSAGTEFRELGKPGGEKKLARNHCVQGAMPYFSSVQFTRLTNSPNVARMKG